MSRSPVRPSRGLRLSLIVAPVLALWVPLLETFGTLSLPLVTWSSAAVFGGFAVLGLVLGGLAAWFETRAVRGGVWRLMYAGVITAIVLAVIDVAVGGHEALGALTPDGVGRLARASVLLGLAAALTAIAWLLHQTVGSLLSWMSAAALVASVALNLSLFLPHSDTAHASAPAGPRSDRSPVLYIVLDEAMGLEGLNAAPDGAPMADALASLFERHGFRWHTHAYSRHFQSGQSIPAALNFDYTSVTYHDFLRNYDGEKVKSQLFAGLKADGYEVITYGTAHIDFCFREASRCEVVESFNPFNPYIEYDEFRNAALVQVVREAMTSSYLVYRYTGLLSRMHDKNLPSVHGAFDVYAFPAWFDRFVDDVVAAPRGRAYFAHFLMPHSPYVFDASCKNAGPGETSYFLTEEHGLTGDALMRERVRRYGPYLEQYGCALHKLDEFLSRVSELREFDDATIVVHGDHGSRISPGQYSENLSDRQLLDNHSALYAIRRPGVPPGPDHHRASVQRLTAFYLGDDPSSSISDDDSTVLVDSTGGGNGPLSRTLPPPPDDQGGPADASAREETF